MTRKAYIDFKDNSRQQLYLCLMMILVARPIRSTERCRLLRLFSNTYRCLNMSLRLPMNWRYDRFFHHITIILIIVISILIRFQIVHWLHFIINFIQYRGLNQYKFSWLFCWFNIWCSSRQQSLLWRTCQFNLSFGRLAVRFSLPVANITPVWLMTQICLSFFSNNAPADI